MERTDFATSRGTLPLWAPAGAFESAKPFALVITGAWAEADSMIRTPALLAPEWDAAVMRLPGNGTPWLTENSIPAWAAAVDELIEAQLPDRLVVPVGLSVGALTALALRAPQVRRIVAIEPPLVMSKLWPMRERLRSRWRDQPEEHAFLSAVFGITGEDRTEERTWFHLFDGAAPVDAVLGAIDLTPPRELPRFPSFVDAPERAWLASQPGVRVHIAAGAGHSVQSSSPQVLLQVLSRALADALAAPRLA